MNRHRLRKGTMALTRETSAPRGGSTVRDRSGFQDGVDGGLHPLGSTAGARLGLLPRRETAGRRTVPLARREKPDGHVGG